MTVDIAARVSATIAAQGETVTYRQLTGATLNSTTLANALTYTDHSIKAHIRRYTAREIAGLIREGDREVRIAASGITFTPKADDVITLSGDVFKVVSVDSRVSYGVDALHILTVRGGH